MNTLEWLACIWQENPETVPVDDAQEIIRTYYKYGIDFHVSETIVRMLHAWVKDPLIADSDEKTQLLLFFHALWYAGYRQGKHEERRKKHDKRKTR